MRHLLEKGNYLRYTDTRLRSLREAVMLWIILGCLAVGVALYVLFCIVVVSLVLHHATKLRLGLLRLAWTTLDEVVAMGHSRFWCEALLPAFYKNGYIEVRLNPGIYEIARTYPEGATLSDEARIDLQDALDQVKKHLSKNKDTFNRHTIALHEFRLTNRGGGKRKFSWKSLLNPLSGWQLAPA